MDKVDKSWNSAGRLMYSQLMIASAKDRKDNVRVDEEFKEYMIKKNMKVEIEIDDYDDTDDDNMIHNMDLDYDDPEKMQDYLDSIKVAV